MNEDQVVDTRVQSFTQQQVDKIIASRIARERAAFEGYETLRGVLDELRAAGALQSSSVKGMAQELEGLIKAGEEGQSKPAGEDTPEDGAQAAVQEADTALAVDLPVENHLDTEEEGYPPVQDEQIRRALAFSSYAAQSASSGLPLSVLYENFERLYSIITGKSEPINGTNDVKSSETGRSVRRELAGTAHGANRALGDYMLTPRQMELARSAGMSCREFAALLGEGKNAKRRP